MGRWRNGPLSTPRAKKRWAARCRASIETSAQHHLQIRRTIQTTKATRSTEVKKEEQCPGRPHPSTSQSTSTETKEPTATTRDLRGSSRLLLFGSLCQNYDLSFGSISTGRTKPDGTSCSPSERMDDCHVYVSDAMRHSVLATTGATKAIHSILKISIL